MAEEKVAFAVAVDEFERMCKSRRVDIDVAAMTPLDRALFENYKLQAVDAIVRGALVVAADGTPTFSPQDTPGMEPFTFYAMTGGDLMAGDRVDGPINKTVATATSLTRCRVGAISKLQMGDFNLVLALTNLFLGSR